MSERGVIRNRDYATQIRDFSGLRFGKITPTDIDGFLDFGNKLFVFVESKFGNSVMPYGQKLAFERLVDACHKPPERISVGFFVSHESSGDINFGKTSVIEYRYMGRWIRPCGNDKSLLTGINAFRELVGINDGSY